ncbi:PRP18-like protein [Aphelenchoides besseyi]|nr:PRP18-like protein [Aphelenchoides besseyi]KAI6209435.1 PRP18-like protein [Aphelenchoides besseyi]
MDPENGDVNMEEDEEEVEAEMDLSIPALRQTLLDQEKEGASTDIIETLWELSKQQISNETDGVLLYTTYIYMCRRMGADIDKLKGLFAEAVEFLGKQFGEYWDPDGWFRKNYAYFLYTKAKEPKEALKLWNDVLKQEDLRQSAELWLDVIRQERCFGTIDGARKLLNRAVMAVTDYPHQIFEYFLQFEREEGTREQVDRAIEKVNQAAARIPAVRQQPKKRKQPSTSSTIKPNAAEKSKTTKESAQKRAKVNLNVEASSMSEKMDTNETNADEKKPSTFKFSTEKEKNKLFVRNIDFSATEDEVREYFGKYGTVKDVRMVRFKNGDPKGIAYVEYEDDETAQRGLAAHDQEFKGRQLIVLISDPSVAKRGKPQAPQPNKPKEKEKPKDKFAKPKLPKKKNETPTDTNVLGGGTGQRTGMLSLKPRILLK